MRSDHQLVRVRRFAARPALVARPSPLPGFVEPGPATRSACSPHIREPDRATLARLSPPRAATPALALGDPATGRRRTVHRDDPRQRSRRAAAAPGSRPAVKWQAVADALGSNPSRSCATRTRANRGASRTGSSWTTTRTPSMEGMIPRRVRDRRRPEASSICATSTRRREEILRARDRARPTDAGLLGDDISRHRLACASASTCDAVRAPTSAARRPRCSTASRASTPSRATARRSRSPTATRTCRRSSTTSRRSLRRPILAQRRRVVPRSSACGEHAGTKLISLSGDVQRPGNYEVPIGLPLRTLLDDWAGGPLRRPRASRP